MTASAPIVLVFPRVQPDFPDDRRPMGLPLSILAVARPLVAAGFDVHLVDENVRPHGLEDLAHLPTPLYVGISCLGGAQIPTALEAAARAQRIWPGVPRVWGGWNPTLLPELYEADDLADRIDVIVRGRGEAQALAIAEVFAAGGTPADLGAVLGLTWRDAAGALHANADAPAEDPRECDHLPYHLIPDHGDYLTRHGILNYMASYGCPHRCEFCGIPAGTRTFKPTNNDVVVEHLAAVKQWGIHTVMFYDDNFFTNKGRVLDLAQRMLDADLQLNWFCNGRVDQLVPVTPDELDLLVRSGCRGINTGYETGDQETADRIHKDIDVDDIFVIAERFAAAGLHLSVNFMVGLRDETPDSLIRSLGTLGRIHAIQPDLEVDWYMFMPVPGTASWDALSAEGLLTKPETLLEHARQQPLYIETPWYYQSPARSIWRETRTLHKAIVWYFYFGYAAPLPRNRLLRLGHPWLRRWCRWRYERQRFSTLLDWRLFFVANLALVRLDWVRAAFLRWRPVDRWRQTRKSKRTVSMDATAGVTFPWIHGMT